MHTRAMDCTREERRRCLRLSHVYGDMCMYMCGALDCDYHAEPLALDAVSFAPLRSAAGPMLCSQPPPNMRRGSQWHAASYAPNRDHRRSLDLPLCYGSFARSSSALRLLSGELLFSTSSSSLSSSSSPSSSSPSASSSPSSSPLGSSPRATRCWMTSNRASCSCLLARISCAGVRRGAVRALACRPGARAKHRTRIGHARSHIMCLNHNLPHLLL